MMTDVNLAAALLDEPFVDRTPISERLWGFGGVHGGLALAVATRAMTTGTDRPVRSITAQFLRPTRSEIVVAVDEAAVAGGRTTDVRTATVWSQDRPSIRATAILGAGSHDTPVHAPSMPDVPPPSTCELFDLPPEFVPFGGALELRPTNGDRPYAGRDEPALSAWIRLRGDDTAVDLGRLIMLSDALAPSYAAVLTDMLLVPTIELTLRPTAAVDHTVSPWLLVHATTTEVSADGWVVEQIDTFAPDGVHLGSAQQLRLVRRP